MNSIWIAREKDGLLYAYKSKPFFDKDKGEWCSYVEGCLSRYAYRLSEDWFPYLKWDDNPIELTNKERAIDALYNVLANFVHGGDADCIIAEFERELDKVE